MEMVVLSDFQTIFCLGYQRVEEELNNTALAGSNFCGDAHTW